MRPDVWNPTQYERFRGERRQPFDDLVALVEPRANMRIVDLGCGTGDLTRELHERFAAASTLGVDRSGQMLARAGSSSRPGLSFLQADIAGFSPAEPFDLVLSNAAIQWVPDHRALLPRLARLVAEEGQLAIQIPASRGPIYPVAQEIAAREPFRTALGGWTRPDPVLQPEDYARLLYDLGFERQHVHLQIYPHVLASRDEVIEWVRGTLLTSYQERMSAPLYEDFLAAYRARLFEALEDRRPFFFPFSRILCWASR